MAPRVIKLREQGEPRQETEAELPPQRKRPEVGRYLLQVDRQTKGSYGTAQAAEAAGILIKKNYPKVQVSVYDSVDTANKLIDLPAELKLLTLLAARARQAGIVVNVSGADRRRLEEIIADRSAPQKHVWRATIILATADGYGTDGGVATRRGRTTKGADTADRRADSSRRKRSRSDDGGNWALKQHRSSRSHGYIPDTYSSDVRIAAGRRLG